AGPEPLLSQVPERIRLDVPLGRSLLRGRGGRALRPPLRERQAEGGKEPGHDPEKWKPVFGKDHAQASSRSGIAIRRKVIPRRRQAASAALACPTIASNAAGSWMARSDRTLRSTVTPALPRPSMKRL